MKPMLAVGAAALILVTACSGGGSKPSGTATAAKAATETTSASAAPSPSKVVWTPAQARQQYLRAVAPLNNLTDQWFLMGPATDISPRALARKVAAADTAFATALTDGNWPVGAQASIAALAPLMAKEAEAWTSISNAYSADNINSLVTGALSDASTASVPAAAAARIALSLPAPSRSNEIGRLAHNLGATVTVTKVEVAASVPEEQQGDGNFSPVPAASGGRFIIVTTNVKNDAKVSMDLTCEYPIATKLVDAQDREFDPIEDLYKLRDNPGCNADLQPGFSEAMQWVYLVPAGTNVVGWSFADYTDTSGPSPSGTTVSFAVTAK